MTIQTSTIDSTKPIAVTPTTQSVRDNFAAAAAEINQCFINDDTLKARVLAIENLPATFKINAVRASRGSAQNLTANVQATILYSTLEIGSAANYNTATGEYTCQEAGLYMVSFALLVRVLVSNSIGKTAIKKNGIEVANGNTFPVNNGNTSPTVQQIYIAAAAGDKLTVCATTTINSTIVSVGAEAWNKYNHVTFLRAA